MLYNNAQFDTVRPKWKNICFRGSSRQILFSMIQMKYVTYLYLHCSSDIENILLQFTFMNIQSSSI